MTHFRSIPVAADFSENSRDAFRLACSLAHPDETRLTVVHAEAPPIVYGEMSVPLTTAAEDRAQLEELAERLRSGSLPGAS